jgi:Flp pilus assembly protein TadD
VHYIMRNYQPAVDDYTKAIQYNANDTQFYLNRGSAYQNLRKLNEARADYEKARSIAPTQKLRQDAQDALNALR